MKQAMREAGEALIVAFPLVVARLLFCSQTSERNTAKRVVETIKVTSTTSCCVVLNIACAGLDANSTLTLHKKKETAKSKHTRYFLHPVSMYSFLHLVRNVLQELNKAPNKPPITPIKMKIGT